MSVLKLNFTLLTQHELLGYLKRVNIILAAYTDDPDSPIGELRISFMNAVHYFDKILKPPTRSAYTEMVQQVRTLRLDQWSGLRSQIRSKCKIKDETISSPAKKANIIMDRYGNVRRITSVACDAAIDNILQDLENELSTDELENLNISDWIELLTKSNQEYKKLVGTRTDDKQKYGIGLTTAARKAAIASYQEIIIGLQYLSMRGTDAEQKICKNFIESINAVLREIKPILKSRATRRKTAGQLPTDPMPEETENPEPENDLMKILNQEE